MVSVTWTGAAGLEFFHEGKTWLIDPYHSRIGKFATFFGQPKPRAQVVERYRLRIPGEVQGIIVTHTHFDHAFDIPILAKSLSCPIYGNRSLETLMGIHGVRNRITICEGREQYPLPGNANLDMIPSFHGKVILGRVPFPGEIDPAGKPPLKASDYRHGQVYIARLEIGGTRFMHVGSAALDSRELEGCECDVLFACVPGWKKFPGFIPRLVDLTKTKVVVPFHFDDFSAPLDPYWSARNIPFLHLKEFVAECQRQSKNIRIVVPRLWQKLEF
jgi:L-ascorbate metabolism protein UlaG (beta-lactamase superfamily)